MRVDRAALDGLVQRALAKLGHDPADAAIIQDVLMYAQLRDSSQGLLKIAERAIRKDTAAAAPRVVARTTATARIDGCRGNGMVVMRQATDLAIDLARGAGAGVVGSFNTATSTGAIGFYVERIARAGLVGIAMSGTPKVVAMAGSTQPVFGTNPIAIALPTPQEPIVLDMATSAAAWFALIEAKTLGRAIPGDVAFDRDGAATTDPAAALDGALRTFGGAKGAGLAFMVEALSGALVGGDLPDEPKKPPSRGNLVIALDPAALGGADVVAAFGRLAAQVQARRPTDPAQPIRLPGARSAARAAAAVGALELPQALYDGIKAVAEAG
jgi:LDH2 family malate/lactate/ureidoglycolate dehydrogenase